MTKVKFQIPKIIDTTLNLTDLPSINNPLKPQNYFDDNLIKINPYNDGIYISIINGYCEFVDEVIDTFKFIKAYVMRPFRYKRRNNNGK